MVHALVRDVTHYPFDKPGIRVFHADLPDSLDETAFQRADFVIHAAYATTANPPTIAMRVNEGGTARVLAAARSAGVARFVFVSSLAAHAGARSYYGRSKHMLEQQLDYSRDLTIRPVLYWRDTRDCSSDCAARSSTHRWCRSSAAAFRYSRLFT